MHWLVWNLNLELHFAWEPSMKPEARNNRSLHALVVGLCLPKNLVHQCFTYALLALTETGNADSESTFHLGQDARSSMLSRIKTKAKPQKKAFLHCTKLFVA